MLPAAAARFRDRAFEFLRRGEKNRSSACQQSKAEVLKDGDDLRMEVFQLSERGK